MLKTLFDSIREIWRNPPGRVVLLTLVLGVGAWLASPLFISGTDQNWAKDSVHANVRQLARVYLGLAQIRNRAIKFGESPQKFEADSPARVALIFHRNDRDLLPLWYNRYDPALAGVDIPKEKLDEAEAEKLLTSVRPISWAVAVNVPRERFADKNFPLLWTRGLQENGTWAQNSPWKGEGGHIVFVDGHVRWTRSIAGLDLTDKTGVAITTLSQLLGDSGAVVLEDKPETLP